MVFDKISEQPACVEKKRRFDVFIQNEIHSLDKIIQLGYHHAVELNPMQGTRTMVARLRKQRRLLEKTRDTWVWDQVGTASDHQSSREARHETRDVDLPAPGPESKGELLRAFYYSY